jgi:hypothetical protein
VLCQSDTFRDRARDAFARLLQQEPVVLLHPSHQGARAVAELTSDLLQERGFGVTVVESDPHALRHLDSQDSATIRQARTLLIVDDVAITGSRLRRYRMWLNMRHLVNELGMPEVGAVLGVLRAASPERVESISNMVDRPDLLITVERLTLPDWGQDECPWCEELKRIRRYGAGRGSLMEERAQALQRGGLIRDLFLPVSRGVTAGAILDEFSRQPSVEEARIVELLSQGIGEQELLENLQEFKAEDHRGREALELGPRSIFGPLQTEAQVFTAVASSLQTLRSWERHPDRKKQGSSLSESFSSPIARVLAPEYFVSGRYYAPIVFASVLRAARRFDIRATAIEGRLRTAVGERFADHDVIRPEMLYAMARGLLPRPTESAIRDHQTGIDESVAEFLAALE